MPMFELKHARKRPSVEIAPLVDVVFLLLLFFLVSSDFVERPGFPIDLPQTENAETRNTEEGIIVTVSSDGELYVKDQRVEASDLEKALRTSLEGSDLKEVVVRADDESRHGLVVGVLDAARGAGAASVTIGTRSEPPDKDRSTPQSGEVNSK